MKEYFLETSGYKYQPIYTEDRQTAVDEGQINESFEPATDTFIGFREAGDWLIDFISDSATQIIEFFM